jgi:hypothetical protein
MDDSYATVVETALRQGGTNGFFLANEVNLLDRSVGLQGELNTVDDGTTSVVATHDIHCDSHKAKERWREQILPRSLK